MKRVKNFVGQLTNAFAQNDFCLIEIKNDERRFFSSNEKTDRPVAPE